MIPQRLNDLNLIYPEVKEVDLRSSLCLVFKFALPVCEIMWFYGIIGLTTTEHTCVLVMEVYLCTHCQSHGIEMHQDIYLNHWSLKKEVQTGPAVSAPCVRFLKACSLIQTSPTYVVKKTDTVYCSNSA